MSHYGISAIHWNAHLAAIDEVRLHRLGRRADGAFAISHAEPAWSSDVMNLIRAGDSVWVVVPVAPGRYKNTDRVRIDVKPGGRGCLYSCASDGTPTAALTELPRYERSDDLP